MKDKNTEDFKKYLMNIKAIQLYDHDFLSSLLQIKLIIEDYLKMDDKRLQNISLYKIKEELERYENKQEIKK